MKKTFGVLAVWVVFPFAHAADINAGKAKAEEVCKACHSANGVGINDTIPNLAGEKVVYIERQLKAFKEGKRKDSIMNAIATSLSADDIGNVAAFFASLPGATNAAKAAVLPGVAKPGVIFTVCAACHGATGVSVNDTIPNLAGQKSAYISAQLKALKEGTRKDRIMNAVAIQLTSDDIDNVATYFASLPGSAPAARSALLPNIAKTEVTFPEKYKSTFTQYHTMSYPVTKQVRNYFANAVALEAIKEGKSLPNGSMLFTEVYSAKLDADKKPITRSDGSYVADQLLFYRAMARNAGWGKDIPEMLRNEEWNYALFTPEKQHRPDINQADCFACHKPLDKVSYAFTFDQLVAFAKKK